MHTMTEQNILEDLLELSISERILLVESLWESIAIQPEEVPMTGAQREELDRRLSALQRGELETASWEDVKRRLRSR